MGRFWHAVAWSFIPAAAAAKSNSEQCADGAGDSCNAVQKGDVYLQTMRTEDVAARVFDDSEDLVRAQKGSCLDASAEMIPIPPDLNQNYKNPEVDYQCKFDVSWEHSDWMLATFEEYGADKETYKFKICWDSHADPEVRKFPWLQSAGSDWNSNLSKSGSVIFVPQDQINTWADGFQNVMPDALDYFCRMGEVLGRKFIPRFMLFGWSKGGTYLWNFGRWRQDLIQASILVHGCNSKYSRWTDDFPTKSKAYGVGPTLFISSKLDTSITSGIPIASMPGMSWMR